MSRVHRPGSIVHGSESRVQRPTIASRVQEFQYACGKVKHELRVTSSNLRVASSNLRVASSNPRVKSSNPRVTSLNSPVTSSNPRTTSSNSPGTSSNPRVRRLKARDAT